MFVQIYCVVNYAQSVNISEIKNNWKIAWFINRLFRTQKFVATNPFTLSVALFLPYLFALFTINIKLSLIMHTKNLETKYSCVQV